MNSAALNVNPPAIKGLGGRLIREGILTPDQARQIAATKTAEAKLGQDPVQARKAAKAEAQASRQAEAKAQLSTLAGFLDTYAPWLEGHRKTGGESIARIRACFADWMDMPLTDINPWLAEKWRKQRREQGRANATLNRDMNALKSLLSTAVDWEIIDHHPLTKLKPAKVDTTGKVRYLTQAEESALRFALDARDQANRAKRQRHNDWLNVRHLEPLPALGGYTDHLTPIILLALNLGCRRGELFKLEWSDIGLDRRQITIRGESAKSGKTRHIPLNTEAQAVLTQWRKQGGGQGLVFPGRSGKPLDNINSAWRRLMKDSGLVAFRFHDLRHTFASKLVMAGVDLNTVRELLGHADIAMTLRYAHLAPAHKAAAVERLNPAPAALVHKAAG